MLNPKLSAWHPIRPSVDALYQLILKVLLRDRRLFHMAAPEQSNLAGPQHQHTVFIGEQHGPRTDPTLVIDGGGDEILKGSNTRLAIWLGSSL